MDTAGKYLFFTLILMLLSGCLFLPYPIEEKLGTGTPINKTELQKIERGKTTGLEIIEWFGPPDAIARMGTTIKVPSLGARKEGSLDVPSQDLLDLFSAKHAVTEKNIVYYYETSAFHAVGAIMVVVSLQGAAGASGPITPLWLMVSRLLILIDTETGHVVDYIFRREKIKKKGAGKGNIDAFKEDDD